MSMVENQMLKPTRWEGITRHSYAKPNALYDPCDICNRHESIVRLGKSKLCVSCAAEEEITVL